MLRLSLCCLVVATLSFAQQKGAPSSNVVHQSENVYSDTWEPAEQKSCTTWSDQKYLLLCDDTRLTWGGSYINLLGANAQKGKDEAHKSALLYAMTHAKTFTVHFSKEPWPKSGKPGSRQNLWDCSKTSTAIKCKFNVGEGT